MQNDPLWQDANKYFQSGEIKRTSIVLQNILAKDRYDMSARINLLNCFSALNELILLMGLIKESIDLYPDSLRFISNYLFCLNYFEINRGIHFNEHKRVFENYLKLQGPGDFILPNLPKNRSIDSQRIRVGYVSGDLHEHSCTYLTIPLLRHHNKNDFEIFVYSNLSHNDKITDDLKSLGVTWVDISNMTNREAAEVMAKDSIDILVDLSGHTVANRLGIFLYRPAPIQMSWYGYLNTTGVPQIDYRITDPMLSPEGMGNEKYYTEKLLRIPRCFLYEPPATVPPVALPAYKKNGYFTFGALHDMKKISNTTLDLWSSILKQLPSSKLMFSIEKEGDIASVIEARFTSRGIPKSQLILIPRVPIEQFFYLFKDIDIMLDTFPYTSGVSAMHALWMGVPTLTIEGETELFRNCAAVMKWSGYPEFIAQDASQFINKAVYYHNNPARLAEIRRICREKPLVDNKAVVASIENKYKEIIKNSK
ncbi:MAG: hypothetical protein Q7S19_01200 [bacterium]|nr:hypothetical protein [bacterium]